MKYFIACLMFCASLGATEYYVYEENQDSQIAEQTPENCEYHRCCRCRHKRWRENPYAQKDSQDVSWAGRRDDELSDQLSR